MSVISDHNDSADPVSQVISTARATEQAIQQLCRTTLTRPSMAPAEVDIVLAHLADAAAALPQAASQLGDNLAQAKQDRVLKMDNLTEIEDPDVAIDTARVHLDGVRDAALDVYRLLNARNETAQIAVAGRPTEETDNIMQDTPKGPRPEHRQPPTVGAVDRWWTGLLTNGVSGGVQGPSHQIRALESCLLGTAVTLNPYFLR